MNLHACNLRVMIGEKVICENLDLQLKPGEVWGILGPNGCGKTTLLHTLAGLHPLAGGELFFNRVNFKKFSPKSIARRVGLLLQESTANFPQTVWDYCLGGRYPQRNYLQKKNEQEDFIVKQALELMGLYHVSKKNIYHLSGGEKRRLAIATILAQAPSTYLLDEPSNHLDIKYQMKILTHFKQLAETQMVAVVMTLHDINLAQQFCDQIILMYPGGELIKGNKYHVLTTDNLSKLFQYSIHSIDYADTIFWYPKVK